MPSLFRGLLDRGVYIAPSQFECMFVSLAHGEDEIDRTVRAVADISAADAELWDVLAREASAESSLWRDALLPQRRAAP